MDTQKLPKNRLFLITIAAFVAAIIIWNLFFYKNPYIKEALPDIHLIYAGTIICFAFIRLTCSTALLEFIKVFVRTLFRVWLLICITFTISKAMERVGILLSLTFMFGYFEGLLDINRWLAAKPVLFKFHTQVLLTNHRNHALLTILFMTIIHILCALCVFIFYLLLKL